MLSLTTETHSGLEVKTSVGIEGVGIEAKLSGSVQPAFSSDYPLFEEIRKFLGDHLEPLFREYHVTDVTQHCFDTINPHPKVDRAATICYGDTHGMVICDQDSHSLSFQKYFNESNRYMLVQHEMRKLPNPNGSIGGDYQVCIFVLSRNERDEPVLVYDSEPARFYDPSRRLRSIARSVAFMKNAVDYLDVEFHHAWDRKKCDDLGMIVCGTNGDTIFSLACDPNHMIFPFEYRRGSVVGYQDIHGETLGRLRDLHEQGAISSEQLTRAQDILFLNYCRLNAVVSDGKCTAPENVEYPGPV
jgi:hypothetical protein